MLRAESWLGCPLVVQRVGWLVAGVVWAQGLGVTVRSGAEACAHSPFCFPQPFPEGSLSLQRSSPFDPAPPVSSPTLDAFKSLLNRLPRQVEARLTPNPTSCTCHPSLHLYSLSALGTLFAKAPHHCWPASCVLHTFSAQRCFAGLHEGAPKTALPALGLSGKGRLGSQGPGNQGCQGSLGWSEVVGDDGQGVGGCCCCRGLAGLGGSLRIPASSAS